MKASIILRYKVLEKLSKRLEKYTFAEPTDLEVLTITFDQLERDK
jgi:hypothetical protein